MTLLLLLAALTCVVCIAAGVLVPTLRPMAVSGGAALIFLVGLFAWWALLYLSAVPAQRSSGRAAPLAPSRPAADSLRLPHLAKGRSRVSTLHVLKVFVGEDGANGNHLGVFLRGAEIPPEERQAVAADLGFSETVFVDDPETGRLRIFTPGAELPFAGHPLVGTAWLLRREGKDLSSLHPPAGEVAVRSDGELTFISGRPEWAPEFEILEFDSPDEVEALEGPPDGLDLVGAWAWEDEEAGHVRVRVFPVRFGIDEDEATGAHAVRLAARLGRRVEIHQGVGSLILAEPHPDGSVEVGGRVEHVETRNYEGARR